MRSILTRLAMLYDFGAALGTHTGHAHLHEGSLYSKKARKPELLEHARRLCRVCERISPRALHVECKVNV